MRTLFLLWLLIALSGCGSLHHKPLHLVGPRLEDKAFVTADGQHLPLYRWQPNTAPEAVIIALHGFNDYGRFIESPAEFFIHHGIVVYAYDQRGFGASPHRGHWAGVETYTQDLITLVALVRKRHPDIPIYVLGESMGGAVAIVAAAGGLAHTDGLILAAPAVWARWTMPWYQRSLLWLARRLTPWVELTGDGLGIVPSNNMEMLRALGNDPLVIKASRVDAIAGLTDLMDQAQASAPRLQLHTLYLYGGNDQIVPRAPTLRFLGQTDRKRVRLAWYDQGYHMLLRDLEAHRYWHDIVSWIETPARPLPSGADTHGKMILTQATHKKLIR